MRRAVLIAAALLVHLPLSAQQAREFKLPPQPRAALFGQVVIQRASLHGASDPVVFSHARHRVRHTCRVCHLELDFAFKRNTTEITEAGNRAGQFCGACHDGKIAFAHSAANCTRCHTREVDLEPSIISALATLPPAAFGNLVDWTKALAAGSIKPRPSLAAGYEPITLGTTLELDADWNFVPPAIFPHDEHTRWLDCANCHPEIFNVKKKSTEHFSMRYNLAGDFCGVCHMHVAFPMNDCKRCHPAMKDNVLQ